MHAHAHRKEKSQSLTVYRMREKYFCFCLVQTPGHTPSLRWDETPGRAKGSETPGATPGSKIWDPTPSHTPAGAATPGRDTPGHATPGHGGATSSARKNRWDETPKTERGIYGKAVLRSFE